MALINCTECNKEISDKASSCPNCGNPMIISEVISTEKSSSWGCMKSILVALILFGIGVPVVNMCTKDDSSNSGYENYSGNELYAYNFATDCVKSRLKSPSTAEFPSTAEKIEDVTYMGDGVYVIKSWVDSQNSFGAMLRSSFECTVKFENGTISCQSVIVY